MPKNSVIDTLRRPWGGLLFDTLIRFGLRNWPLLDLHLALQDRGEQRHLGWLWFRHNLPEATLTKYPSRSPTGYRFGAIAPELPKQAPDQAQ
jgi:hypothetical protein